MKDGAHPHKCGYRFAVLIGVHKPEGCNKYPFVALRVGGRRGGRRNGHSRIDSRLAGRVNCLSLQQFANSTSSACTKVTGERQAASASVQPPDRSFHGIWKPPDYFRVRHGLLEGERLEKASWDAVRRDRKSVV